MGEEGIGIAAVSHANKCFEATCGDEETVLHHCAAKIAKLRGISCCFQSGSVIGRVPEPS